MDLDDATKIAYEIYTCCSILWVFFYLHMDTQCRQLYQQYAKMYLNIHCKLILFGLMLSVSSRI